MMAPTTNSKIIKCNYFLEVRFEHAGITMGTRIPDIVMNLIVYPPSVGYLNKITAPTEGWNPTKL